MISHQHPKGLSLLFFTGVWERFGFYTIQTIIILYMTKALHLTDTDANIFYAAFSSLCYLTPSLGGYIADKYLGFKKAIVIGGMLFIASYIAMACPGQLAFFLGLSLLIVANGFFNPNLSSIVGDLYQENDVRREGGFTLFYMGINLGSLVPPLIAGFVVKMYGWHAGFALAAIGMLIGQLLFVMGGKSLGQAGAVPAGTTLTLRFYSLLFVGTAALVQCLFIALHYPEFVDFVVVAIALVLVYVVALFLTKESKEAQRKMFACLILIVISIGFWALYNQSFSSLMLFADRNMTKTFYTLTLNTESTQFFNPFFIIILSPLINQLWSCLDKYHLNPSIAMKFCLGLLLMSSGYLVLAFGAHYDGVVGMTSPWWLIWSYFLQTCGELFLSPIGLSMITVLCPKHLVGMMMGVWYFSTAASFALSGTLANFAAVPSSATPIESLTIYMHAFSIYGVIGIGMTALSLLFVPLIKRLSQSNEIAPHE
jgi:POT family proton-dependent oligopeptide transporter